MVNVGIVGHGYVGKAVEYRFKSKNKVLVYDKYLPLKSLPEVVEKMDKRYTKIDLSIVESVVKEIHEKCQWLRH